MNSLNFKLNILPTQLIILIIIFEGTLCAVTSVNPATINYYKGNTNNQENYTKLIATLQKTIFPLSF